MAGKNRSALKLIVTFLAIIMVLVAVIVVVLLCPKNKGQAAPHPAPLAANLTDAFNAANGIAKRQDVVSVYTKLEPLTKDSPYHDATGGWVSMAAVKTAASVQTYWSGETTDCTYAKEANTWVSMAPQLKAFCSNTRLKGQALSLRVAQWLGLYPTTDYTQVVLFQVRQEDMFRPCPDPETNDTVCNAMFSVGPQGNTIVPPITPASKSSSCPTSVAGLGSKYANSDYQDFFTALFNSSYDPDGLPWTRLGYTYDWNPYTPRYGVSEYIVKANAVYQDKQVLSLDDFCALP